MEKMIVIYVTCVNTEEARRIGTYVIKKRLAPCYNILHNTYSAAFWPPNTGEIEEVTGAVLLIKTLEDRYVKVEKEVKAHHSDKNPCIFSIPVAHVSKEYYDWLVNEMDITE